MSSTVRTSGCNSTDVKQQQGHQQQQGRQQALGRQQQQAPYTVKKDCCFPIPSGDVTNQTRPGRELLNYSRPG